MAYDTLCFANTRQDMIDGEKPGHSKQRIYFRDRQQDEKKEECHGSTKGHNLVFQQCAAGDINGILDIAE